MSKQWSRAPYSPIHTFKGVHLEALERQKPNIFVRYVQCREGIEGGDGL